MFKADILIE